MATGDDTRQRVLRGAYECIGRHGMAKTTVDDVAAASGVSRATIYRIFPGGKDELLRDTVGWEMDNFFLRLGEELGDAADFPEFLERALPLARQELLEHTVLQKVLETEPDRLNALITVQQHRIVGAIAAYFQPLLERDRDAGRVATDVDLAVVAEYVARLSLSLIASPGRHDLTDAAEVRHLVRGELLGGVLLSP
jgi:AcrR family transcriptional regulator